MTLNKRLAHLLVSAGVLFAGFALHAGQKLAFTNRDERHTTVEVKEGDKHTVLELWRGQTGTVVLQAEPDQPTRVTVEVSAIGGSDEDETRSLHYVYKTRENPEGDGLVTEVTLDAANTRLGTLDFVEGDHLSLSFSWAERPETQGTFEALARNHRKIMDRREMERDAENFAEAIRRGQRAEAERNRRARKAKAAQGGEGAACWCVVL